MKDEELLSHIKSNDSTLEDQAFSYFYREYYTMINNLILKNSGSSEETQDIFQDAIINFYNQVKYKDLKLTCSIKTYLYSISRNLWLAKLRKRGREVELKEFEDFVDTTKGSLNKILSDERFELIGQLFDKVGKDCKQILTFFYIDRLSFKEINELLEYPSMEALRTKKSRCMSNLRKNVNEHSFYQKHLRP